MLFQALRPVSVAVPAVDRRDFGLLASRTITIGSEALAFTDFLWEAFLAYGIIGSGYRIGHLAKFVKFDKYSNLMRSRVCNAAFIPGTPIPTVTGNRIIEPRLLRALKLPIPEVFF